MYQNGDVWHNDKFMHAKKTDNDMLNEKILACIKNVVRGYFLLFQSANEGRIDAYSRDLLDAGYTPAQIKDVLDDLKNSEASLAAIAHIRSFLSVKFKPAAAEKLREASDIEKKIKMQIERFKNQRAHFVKQTSEDALKRFTVKYLTEVFGGTINPSELGFDTWARIALADFYDAECDFKRAFELGKKRADDEYLLRRGELPMMSDL